MILYQLLVRMRYLELFVLLFFVALSACQSCTDDGFGGEVLPEDIVEDVPWWQDEPEDVQEEITLQYLVDQGELALDTKLELMGEQILIQDYKFMILLIELDQN